MSAKKRTDKRAGKTQQQVFSSSPFSSMKGLDVSETPLAGSNTKPQRPEPETEAEPEKDADFTAAMGNIGVQRLEGQEHFFVEDVAEGQTERQPEGEKHPSSFAADELNDDDLFLYHLGQMDTMFNDSYPEDPEAAEPQPGSARRMRQLRKGRLRPEASLDLHGCNRAEAHEKVRVFLQNRQRAGMKTVLIITGRGQRSQGGEPVLRNDVETYLRTKASAWVIEWGRAPKQYGGDGALVVFLRN
ncbi:MAG: Smr/MutS family protein [Desulfuromonas sp.]